VSPSLQPVEVESPPDIGCMVPQSFAAVENRSYPGALGCNWWPTVPGVIYPDNIHLKFYFQCCVLYDETRYHLHDSKKITHRYFKSSLSICTSRIDHVDFFIFWPSKIYVSPTGVVSSLSLPRCRLSSGRRCHAAAPSHASFP
jgi:hypothetical protein